MSNEVVSRSAWAATLGLSRLRASGTSASTSFFDLGGIESSVVTGELGEGRGVHESLCSRCGEDAFLAQCLGQLAFELLIVLRLDGLGVAVAVDEPERPDQRSHVVTRQAVRGGTKSRVGASQQIQLRRVIGMVPLC